MKALVLIPVHRDADVNPYLIKPLRGKTPLERTIRFAERLGEIDDLAIEIALVTDDDDIARASRPHSHIYLPERTENSLQGALREGLVKSEKHYKTRFDIVFVLEPPHAFRPWSLAVEAYEMFRSSDDLDSVVCVEQLHGRIWAGDGTVRPLADSLSVDFYGATAPFREVVGLLLITRRDVLMEGTRIGASVGLVVVDKKWGFVDIRSQECFEIAERLADMLET